MAHRGHRGGRKHRRHAPLTVELSDRQTVRPSSGTLVVQEDDYFLECPYDGHRVHTAHTNLLAGTEQLVTHTCRCGWRADREWAFDRLVDFLQDDTLERLLAHWPALGAYPIVQGLGDHRDRQADSLDILECPDLALLLIATPVRHTELEVYARPESGPDVTEPLTSTTNTEATMDTQQVNGEVKAPKTTSPAQIAVQNALAVITPSLRELAWVVVGAAATIGASWIAAWWQSDPNNPTDSNF
jgi:hypothetical protein